MTNTKMFVAYEPIDGNIHRCDTKEEAVKWLEFEIAAECSCNGVPDEYVEGEAFVAELTEMSTSTTIDELLAIDLTPASPLNAILSEIKQERLHQLSKGFDVQHDQKQQEYFSQAHKKNKSINPLLTGAVCFCNIAKNYKDIARIIWPWHKEKKDSGYQGEINTDITPREALVKAAAMIMAEIERIDYEANQK